MGDFGLHKSGFPFPCVQNKRAKDLNRENGRGEPLEFCCRVVGCKAFVNVINNLLIIDVLISNDIMET